MAANLTYSATIGLRVCEEIAQGRTLSEVLKEPGSPSRPTWYRWLLLYPKLRKAYDAAKVLSAESMEEDLLDMVSALKDDSIGFSAMKLDRWKQAMQQLRWSAAHRDPGRYGERQQASVVVPVQIVTNMDLGGSAGQQTEYGDVYHLEVEVNKTKVADAEVEELPDDETGWGLDADEKAEVPRAPRRKKGHKSAHGIAQTLRARGRRNGTVRHVEGDRSGGSGDGSPGPTD